MVPTMSRLDPEGSTCTQGTRARRRTQANASLHKFSIPPQYLAEPSLGYVVQLVCTDHIMVLSH